MLTKIKPPTGVNILAAIEIPRVLSLSCLGCLFLDIQKSKHSKPIWSSTTSNSSDKSNKFTVAKYHKLLFSKASPIAQWSERCPENLQTVNSNPVYIYVCRLCFADELPPPLTCDQHPSITQINLI